MRKTKKTLAILAIVAMVLTMIPLQAFAATTGSTGRLGGTDRIDTAIKIADAGFTSASTVIVAPADDANLVDALAAAPLAGTSSPILLTYKSGLDPRVQAEITKLGAKTVDLVGAAANNAVANALSGVTVVKLAGSDRAATADAINAKLSSPAGTFVVGYDAIPDALSVASFAAANNYAIVLANPDGTVNASKLVGSKTYLVGGTGVVKDYAGATRLGGANRFATNAAVVSGLQYSYTNVYVANGLSLVDALVAAPVAAKSKAPVLLTDGSSVAANVGSSLTSSSQVVALGGSGAVSDSVVGSVAGGTSAPAPAGGPVAVSSVKATGANTIQVNFSAAPADVTKIAFAVTNSGAPFAVTASWDSTKAVATLTSSANFPQGTYSVNVKNGTTDLGTNTVTVTQQTIAQINITSSKLAVITDTNNNNKQYGYATFKVLDQYGNDITGSYLANNINFQSGVGNITTPSTGVLKIDPGSVNLLTFSTVVITAFDTTSGISTSATLATSTAMGTLSSITLNKLTSATNAVLTAADTSDTWYIDYSAKDMSGNDTKDYNLVTGGLILTGNSQLSSSSPYVIAQIVHDPNDSNKAAIQVTVTSDTVSMDMPVTITAMSYQGAPSSLNVTLKKQSAIDSFTLMAPSFSIASNEYKQIPFIAYNQNGSQMTQYSDLAGASQVTLTGFGVDGGFIKNPDGTASLYVRATTLNPGSNQSVPQILSAVTPTGKLSTLTLNIQPAAKADTLSLTSGYAITALQEGASERFDYGYNYGGLTVNDQYGRPMNLDVSTGDTGAVNTNYEVVATTTGGALTINQLYYDKYRTGQTGYAVATNGQGIEILAKTNLPSTQIRTQTVNFYLIKKSDLNDVVTNGKTNLAISSQSVTFSVVKNSDIQNYTIDQLTTAIYATSTTPASVTANTITAQAKDWAVTPKIYGATAGGAKVLLANGFIKGQYVDDTTHFASYTTSGGTSTNSSNAFDSVRVLGLAIDPSQNSASGNLTVTIMGADGLIHTVSTPISSTTASPVAKSMGLNIDTTIQNTTDKAAIPGVNSYANANAFMHLSDNGQTLYIDNAPGMQAELYVGALLQRNDTVGANTGRADVYFYGKDQYGKKGMTLANVYVVDYGNGTTSTFGTLPAKLAIDSNGRITANNMGSGDYVVLSGVTTNGLVLTVKVVANY